MKARKPKFIVKPEDGVVVCILDNTMLDLVQDLKIPFDAPMECVEPLLLNESYKGIARLSKDDTWNEEFGRNLAFEKAYVKYKAAKVKKLTKLMNIYFDTAQILKDIITDIETE